MEPLDLGSAGISRSYWNMDSQHWTLSIGPDDNSALSVANVAVSERCAEGLQKLLF